jgi:predicted metalloprotease with PDZ domain
MTGKAPRPASPGRRPAEAAIHYQIRLEDVQAHLFRITLRIAKPAAEQALQMPVWIPGSYLVREFSKQLQGLECRQNGRLVRSTQTDKARWQVSCNTGHALEVTYAVFAYDTSVRTAWLDPQRGFFNGTSLLLQAVGQEDTEHTLHIAPSGQMPHWRLATGLAPLRTDKRGFGLYHAPDYDTLVDCPVEMGDFWSGEFTVEGVPHQFVVAGVTESFDGHKLLADTKAICETAIRFWHGVKGKPPFARYVFLLNAVADGYGGLEHRNSTALLCTRTDLPRKARTSLAPAQHRQPEGYTTLQGLISHEYFHAWNVKRLRPAEFARYDYTRENYTELLWFFEGFTSYYDDLLLRRSSLIDNSTYLKLLAKTFNQVAQTPGRKVQTVAQASFDAWIKYYRPDENTPNSTVSYYTKGALVALCLDLTLRAEGQCTLDAVMRGLWERCKAGPMSQDDLLAVLQALTGRSYAADIARWVHGTAELPVLSLLEKHGVRVRQEPAQVAQQLGLRVKESGGALIIQHVLQGSVAQAAGLSSGDEWLAIQASQSGASGPWRMQSLDDLLLYAGNARQVHITVARDRRLHTLTLRMPKASTTVQLSVADKSLLDRWLDNV